MTVQVLRGATGAPSEETVISEPRLMDGRTDKMEVVSRRKIYGIGQLCPSFMDNYSPPASSLAARGPSAAALVE